MPPPTVITRDHILNPMKTSRLLILALVVGLSAVSVPSASARPKLKPTPTPQKSEAGTVIEGVSGDSVTIKASKTTTTYKVDNRTAIRVNGVPGTTANLKKGMHAEVTASGLNPGFALSVTAND